MSSRLFIHLPGQTEYHQGLLTVIDGKKIMFYPYRSIVTAPGKFEVELLVRNHLFKTAQFEIELKSSPGVECSNVIRRFSADGKKSVRVPFLLWKTAAKPQG